jgi:hypothetical protein
VRPRRRVRDASANHCFGHIVIDGAQDLSPRRAIARRCEHGSITLLGDLARGTTPWAARDWVTTLAHLGKPQARVVPLTTGFWVPEAVVALANRLLPALAVNMPAGRSLRRDGWLVVHHVPHAVAATAAVRTALESDGSVGVIAPDARVTAVADRPARPTAARSTALTRPHPPVTAHGPPRSHQTRTPRNVRSWSHSGDDSAECRSRMPRCLSPK